MFFLSTVFLSAQGSFVVLQTGGGQPLVSDQQTLQIGGVASPAIAFDFGFATDENVVPGSFLDSFSVTIQDESLASLAVVTVDASGVVWAPFSPGAVVLAESEIARTAIVPPGTPPILGRGVAFSVIVPLPAQFTGPSVTVYFDLFDNMDELMSLGWYDNASVIPIPEPRSAWFFVLGFSFLTFAIWRKQNT